MKSIANSQTYFSIKYILTTLTLIVFFSGCSDSSKPSSNQNLTPHGNTITDSSDEKMANPKETVGLNERFFENISEGELSESKILAHYLTDVVSPGFENLKTQSQLFEMQVMELCKSTEWDSIQLTQTQKIYRELLSAFRQVEPLTIPEVTSEKENWPLSFFDSSNFNMCWADLFFNTANVSEQNSGLKAENILSGGLLKYLEYYLYTPTEKQSCDLTGHPEIIEASKRLQVSEQRCISLKFISRQLVEKTESLDRQLKTDSPEIQNYITQLQLNKKSLLSPILNSLRSIEIFKDAKLGKPIGLSKECISPTRKCPESIEDNLSKLSFESFETILASLKSVFFGVSGAEKYSLAALLSEKGQSRIARHVSITLELAKRTLQSLRSGPSFEKLIQSLNLKACSRTTVSSREVEICALYRDLDELSTLISEELIQAVVPERTEQN